MGRAVATAVGITIGLVVFACALPAAAQPRFEHLTIGDSPAETYELSALGLVHMDAGNVLLFVHREWWRPVRGKYRESMTFVDFFEATGRPDLAAAQSARNTWSDLLFYGGLVAILGGAILGVHGGATGNDPEAYAGIGVAGAGLVSAIVGGTIGGPVVDEDTASRLGQDYNDALRAHLKVATGEGRMPSRAFLGDAAGPMMMVRIAF